jgi:hypothetical protein
MRDLEKIRDIVRKFVASELAPVEILDVNIEESVDRSGEEYLRVGILYDGISKDLDTRKTVSMIRLLRPVLLEKAGETAFPVISYISSSDLGGERHFAAA